MKRILRILFLVFGLGMLLIVVGIVTGASFTPIFGFFNEDDKYGDLMTYEVTDYVDTIRIDTSVRDLSVVLTDDEDLYMTYYEHEDDTWVIDEEDGVLLVEQDRKVRFRLFNFGFSSSEFRELTVYLPRDGDYALDFRTQVGKIDLAFAEVEAFESVRIQSSTGNITLKNLDVAADFEVKTQTGSMDLDKITCQDLEAMVSTGKMTLENIAANALDLTNSTGKIQVSDSVIANDVNAQNSMGDIVMTRVTASAFDLESSTGSIEVILDSALSIEFDLRTTLGEVEVFGQDQGQKHVTNTGDIILKASVSTGSIKIKAA